ncbi:hypothetical protein EG329_011769 [Mollisiaceae sp. DMI_Dod_QoI]|nr:hypothetical protein EG329_011769 [Helotiales sp. DMI_Dod_QoI]
MSATLEGYISVNVHANHKEMVKFRTKNDNSFVRLVGDLMRWQGKTRSITSQFMPASRQASAYSNLNNVLSTLSIAMDAPFNAYNHQHESACLPNTRVDLLQKIYGWADGKNGHNEQCIFWLNGLAGTGKSTISHIVAYKYNEQKRFGASFFFSRGGGDAGHAGKFFTSLAVQLAFNVPSLRQYISKAVKNRSDIASLSLSK